MGLEIRLEIRIGTGLEIRLKTELEIKLGSVFDFLFAPFIKSNSSLTFLLVRPCPEAAGRRAQGRADPHSAGEAQRGQHQEAHREGVHRRRLRQVRDHRRGDARPRRPAHAARQEPHAADAQPRRPRALARAPHGAAARGPREPRRGHVQLEPRQPEPDRARREAAQARSVRQARVLPDEREHLQE